jgi:hypothetical protein
MSHKVAKEALNNFKNSQNGMMKFFNYINKFEGDVFNILVANFGTAFVCPLVIAYNPISKEDKKTRVYSAWREPISAVIATVTQLTLSLNAERYIDKFKYKSFNGKPALGRRLDFTVIKDIITDLEPDKKAKILSMVYKDFETEELKGKFTSELKLHKKDFIFSQLGNLENLSDNSEKLANLNSNEINAINKLILCRIGKAEITELISLKAEQVAEKVKKMVLSKSVNSIEDTTNLLKEGKCSCQTVFCNLVNQNKNVKQLLLKTIENKNVVDKSAKEILAETLKKDIKSGIISIFNTRSENLKQFKNISSIALALATVPFVTVLLNWIYPRFMEKFFPQLSKDNQKNSGT